MFERTVDFIITAVLKLKSVLSASFFLLCVYFDLPFVNTVKCFQKIQLLYDLLLCLKACYYEIPH